MALYPRCTHINQVYNPAAKRFCWSRNDKSCEHPRHDALLWGQWSTWNTIKVCKLIFSQK